MDGGPKKKAQANSFNAIVKRTLTARRQRKTPLQSSSSNDGDSNLVWRIIGKGFEDYILTALLDE
jgi:hypothetical protein